MSLDPKLLSPVSFQKLGSGQPEIWQANPRTDEGGKMAQTLEGTGSIQEVKVISVIWKEKKRV